MTVSRETGELLDRYAALIRKWNPAINLVSASTVSEIGTRHIADSVQLAKLSEISKDSWADLGSGGGLPGLVIGICRPDLPVTLIESDKRKAAFLRTAARELLLRNVMVVSERIESVSPLGVENVSARALAPLPLLLSYVDRHLIRSGRAWLMKGRNWEAEVLEARKQWQFDLDVHASETDPQAVILELTGIRHD